MQNIHSFSKNARKQAHGIHHHNCVILSLDSCTLSRSGKVSVRFSDSSYGVVALRSGRIKDKCREGALHYHSSCITLRGDAATSVAHPLLPSPSRALGQPPGGKPLERLRRFVGEGNGGKSGPGIPFDTSLAVRELGWRCGLESAPAAVHYPVVSIHRDPGRS